MAKTKHLHYDSAEMLTLKRSSIPAAIMASEGTRFDSAEDASVFFARELDHVKAQSYDVEYPELTALHLFPQTSEADPVRRPSPTTPTTRPAWRRSLTTTPPTCPVPM